MHRVKVGGTSDEVISYANAKPERVLRGTRTHPMRTVWPAAGARSTRRDRKSKGAISERESRPVRQEKHTRLCTCKSAKAQKAEHLRLRSKDPVKPVGQAKLTRLNTRKTGKALMRTYETGVAHEAAHQCECQNARG